MAGPALLGLGSQSLQRHGHWVRLGSLGKSSRVGPGALFQTTRPLSHSSREDSMVGAPLGTCLGRKETSLLASPPSAITPSVLECRESSRDGDTWLFVLERPVSRAQGPPRCSELQESRVCRGGQRAGRPTRVWGTGKASLQLKEGQRERQEGLCSGRRAQGGHGLPGRGARSRCSALPARLTREGPRGSILDSCKPTHVHTHRRTHALEHPSPQGKGTTPRSPSPAAAAQRPPRGSRVTHEVALPSSPLCLRARQAATLRSHTGQRARAPGRLTPASSCASPPTPVMALWAAHLPLVQPCRQQGDSPSTGGACRVGPCGPAAPSTWRLGERWAASPRL